MILHLVVSTLLENDTIIYVLQIQNLVYNHTFTRIHASHEYSLPLSTGENGIPPGVFLVPGLLLT